MKTLFRITVLFLYVQLSFAVGLIPGESITRDPVTGNYIAIFWDEDPEGLGNDRFARATFETATKIEPTVRSRLKLHQDWGVGYQYQVSNGKGAKQSIVDFDLYGLPLNTQLLNTQKVMGSDNTVLLEFYNFGMQAPLNTCWYGSGANNGQTVNIGWYCKSWDYSMNGVNTSFGIAPGASLGGFGLASLDLPGIFVAKLVGNTKWHHFSFGGAGPDNEKSSIGNQMGKIVRNDNIPHNIAAPLISVPTPFDPAIVLDNLRTHVASWPSKQLADATFAAQLDRYLLSAAEAYRHNQPKAGKEHIETLRDLLKRVHKDLEDDDEEHDGKQSEEHSDHQPVTQAAPIDSLAARVLDFDLKYVQQRMTVEDKSKR